MIEATTLRPPSHCWPRRAVAGAFEMSPITMASLMAATVRPGMARSQSASTASVSSAGDSGASRPAPSGSAWTME